MAIGDSMTGFSAYQNAYPRGSKTCCRRARRSKGSVASSRPQVLPDPRLPPGRRQPNGRSGYTLNTHVQGRPGVTRAPGAPVASIPTRLYLGSGAGTSALDTTERSARPFASAWLTADVHPSGLRLPTPRAGTRPFLFLRSSPPPAI